MTVECIKTRVDRILISILIVVQFFSCLMAEPRVDDYPNFVSLLDDYVLGVMFFVLKNVYQC